MGVKVFVDLLKPSHAAGELVEGEVTVEVDEVRDKDVIYAVDADSVSLQQTLSLLMVFSLLASCGGSVGSG